MLVICDHAEIEHCNEFCIHGIPHKKFDIRGLSSCDNPYCFHLQNNEVKCIPYQEENK
jgi:hypothetical protein